MSEREQDPAEEPLTSDLRLAVQPAVCAGALEVQLVVEHKARLTQTRAVGRLEGPLPPNAAAA